MGSSRQEIRRRSVLCGVVGGAGVLAGCAGGGDSPAESGTDDGEVPENSSDHDGTGGSATHGGIRVAVVHHTWATEYVDRAAGSEQPCIASVPTSEARLSITVEAEPVDDSVDGVDAALFDGATVVCGETEYELQSIMPETGETSSASQFELGFQVPADNGECQLAVAWQGEAASSETFQLGLGPEREPEIPEDVPSCSTTGSGESFEIRVRNETGEERLLHGVAAITGAGSIEERNGSYQFMVEYSDEGAETVVTRLEEFGAFENPEEMSFAIVLDRNVVTTLGFSEELAAMMERGEWQADPRLLMMFNERETAERVRSVILGKLTHG
jgi:hypothetical protein